MYYIELITNLYSIANKRIDLYIPFHNRESTLTMSHFHEKEMNEEEKTVFQRNQLLPELLHGLLYPMVYSAQLEPLFGNSIPLSSSSEGGVELFEQTGFSTALGLETKRVCMRVFFKEEEWIYPVYKLVPVEAEFALDSRVIEDTDTQKVEKVFSDMMTSEIPLSIRQKESLIQLYNLPLNPYETNQNVLFEFIMDQQNSMADRTSFCNNRNIFSFEEVADIPVPLFHVVDGHCYHILELVLYLQSFTNLSHLPLQPYNRLAFTEKQLSEISQKYRRLLHFLRLSLPSH